VSLVIDEPNERRLRHQDMESDDAENGARYVTVTKPEERFVTPAVSYGRRRGDGASARAFQPPTQSPHLCL